MMIEWFIELETSNQIAILVAMIAAVGGIVVAIINGIFNLISKRKNGEPAKYTVNQEGHDNATQIGIQFNNQRGDE